MRCSCSPVPCFVWAVRAKFVEIRMVTVSGQAWLVLAVCLWINPAFLAEVHQLYDFLASDLQRLEMRGLATCQSSIQVPAFPLRQRRSTAQPFHPNTSPALVFLSHFSRGVGCSVFRRCARSLLLQWQRPGRPKLHTPSCGSQISNLLANGKVAYLQFAPV